MSSAPGNTITDHDGPLMTNLTFSIIFLFLMELSTFFIVFARSRCITVTESIFWFMFIQASVSCQSVLTELQHDGKSYNVFSYLVACG